MAGKVAAIENPADSQRLGIETIYQTLALADNLDSVANLFLGRELTTRWGTLDEYAMEKAARDVFHRLNPNFKNIRVPVRSLSGGQRQVVAISRALHFNARALIMDEPCAALGPEETRMVHDLIRKLKAGGVAIFLISHDMPDVFGLSDRLSVMKNGKTVGTYRTADVTEDEVLGMIIAGKKVTRVAECFAASGQRRMIIVIATRSASDIRAAWRRSRRCAFRSELRFRQGPGPELLQEAAPRSAESDAPRANSWRPDPARCFRRRYQAPQTGRPADPRGPPSIAWQARETTLPRPWLGSCRSYASKPDAQDNDRDTSLRGYEARSVPRL